MINKKIAYLISAYTEPLSLKNLVDAVDDERVDIFIHIDKKVDIVPFYNAIQKKSNIFFLPDNLRIKVFWGGYSQVEMQNNMIKYMFSLKRKYEKIVNLTGTDYPLISNDKLIKKLCNKEKEYIIGFDISNEEYINGEKRPPHQNRFLYYFRMDGNRILKGIVRRMKIKKARSYYDLKYNFYYGSEYWALSYDCLRELVKIYDSDSKLQKIMKYSFTPSESWIHTIFFNSEWKDKGIEYSDWEHRELAELSPLTYFDYKLQVKVLNMDDWNKILDSKKMFARKIIVGKSDKLIEKINEFKENKLVIK